MGDNTTAGDEVSIQVGELKVQGFIHPSTKVANYLGIQYATIPARFRQSKATHLSALKGVLDATQYGPRCPQLTVNRPETAHLYEGVRRSSEYPVDEFGCLRLNIYVPQDSHGPRPVVVWIHGGGFIFGDGNSEFDGNYLVQHSVEKGKPVIYVAMNYRLGFFGFLASRELRAEAEASGETPFSNMAMHDQRVALLWIQEHIQHFGGDPANVTIAGESAGGWSVLAHLRSDVPVCRRGIILSSPNLDYPRPEEAQETFDELVASAGVAESASAEEKLRALRDLDSMQVVKLMVPRLATPLWDDKWFVYQDGKRPIAGPAPFAPWVEGVVVGSTRDEAALFGLGQWKTWTSQQFEDRVLSSFSDRQLAQELADAYGISATAPAEKCLAGFVAMATDSIFSGLPYIIAEHFAESSPPVSLYRFDQADTFEQSPLKGYAYHALDNPFFCRLPAVAGPNADPNMRETANRLSQATLDFAYGSQPWPVYGTKHTILVFNGVETRSEELTEQDRWRRITMLGDLARAKGTWRSGNKLLGIRHSSMDKA
ncbi:carboxylesterase [Cladophialophora carrionii]|uniref:Carboxylic ester hydrolase n=1 Tax=Cladophialophora carrionii TaxID=86049 RepID=A0A1C1CSR8_9EURO|nr:carboxylesterase [Cladophialophora carrionii]